MLDDVRDLGRAQPVVDRDEHAAVAADPEVADHEPAAVWRHERHPRAGRDSHPVQRQRHPAGPGRHLPVRDPTERAGRAGLVDDRWPIRVDRLCTFEEVTDRKRNLHLPSLLNWIYDNSLPMSRPEDKYDLPGDDIDRVRVRPRPPRP